MTGIFNTFILKVDGIFSLSGWFEGAVFPPLHSQTPQFGTAGTLHHSTADIFHPKYFPMPKAKLIKVLLSFPEEDT